MKPKTRYAKSGDVHIAYQLVGDGPFDLVFIPGFVSNVEWWFVKLEVARRHNLDSLCTLRRDREIVRRK